MKNKEVKAPKKVTVSMTIDEDLKDYTRKEAKSQDRSMSSFVTKLIKEYRESNK